MEVWSTVLDRIRRSLGGWTEPPRAAGALSGPGTEHLEFADLLAGIGARPAQPDGAGLQDATIAALQEMLADLRPLGDRLAQVEQELLRLRAALGEREEELRRGAAERATLQRKLRERESVLARERKRLEQTRKKLAERQQVAAERWRELRSLRARASRLERKRAAR